LFFANSTSVSAQQPTTLRYYKSLGIVNMYEGNYLDAVRSFQKAVSLDPADRETLSLLATVYDSIGEKQLSIKTKVRMQTLNVSFNKGKEVEVPSIKNDLRVLGNSFYNRGLYDSAVVCYSLHLMNNRDDTAAIFYMANAYFYNKEYPKAIQTYELLLSKDRNRADAYNLTGVSYLRLKDYIKAREQFRQSVLKDDKFAASYFNLGEVHYALEDFILAQVNLEKALELLPNDKDVLLLLGKIYKQTRQREKALNVFEKLLNLDAKNATFNYEIASLYSEFKDYEKAKTFYLKALKADKNPNINAGLGSVYLNLKMYKEALEQLRIAAKVFTEKKELLYQAAFAANQCKEFKLAETYASQAFALDPKYKNAILELAYAYRALKKRKEAKKYEQMASVL
jgi:tetratricopeptide (TPR) repeat protein